MKFFFSNTVLRRTALKSFLTSLAVFVCFSGLNAQVELGPAPLPHVSDTLTENSLINISSDQLSSAKVAIAPANDNCASATVLTIGASLSCSQTSDQAGVQAGECIYPPGGGMSAQTVWYRITATNDSLVLNYLVTNSPTFVSYVTVYGPFAPGAGCLPACTNTIYTAVQNGDPGCHILLTGLATTGNHDYLIQIQGFNGGGSGDGFVNYCINVVNPAANTTVNSPSVINNCGTTYNGTTNGGYWATGTSTGFNNLDNNNATTVAGASQAGDDVTFVVNNISWFKFCTVNAGVYNVQFDVISCVFSGVNSGAQMAILTGTTTALTSFTQAPNPTYTNTAVWTSPNFTLAAGTCAYLVVDGFAGDACSYSYVLTNVSGGCLLLPIELVSFSVKHSNNKNSVTWTTASESNNKGYILQRSNDALNWNAVTFLEGKGNSNSVNTYVYNDTGFESGENYYRLEQVDFDGKKNYSQIINVDNASGIVKKVVKKTNYLGQEVYDNYSGAVIYHYSDGTCKLIFQEGE